MNLDSFVAGMNSCPNDMYDLAHRNIHFYENFHELRAHGQSTFFGPWSIFANVHIFVHGAGLEIEYHFLKRKKEEEKKKPLKCVLDILLKYPLEN